MVTCRTLVERQERQRGPERFDAVAVIGSAPNQRISAVRCDMGGEVEKSMIIVFASLLAIGIRIPEEARGKARIPELNLKANGKYQKKPLREKTSPIACLSLYPVWKEMDSRSPSM